MTKTRKVVMAALAGSMLMGSMPATAGLNPGDVKIGIGSILGFIAGGLGGGAFGGDYAKAFSISFCAIAILDTILLLRDGFKEKAWQEGKALRSEIRAEVLDNLDRFGLIREDARKRMKDFQREDRGRRK